MMTRYGWLAVCLTAVVVSGLASTAVAQETSARPMTPGEMLAAALANARDPGSRVTDSAEPVNQDLADELLPFDRDETPIIQFVGLTIIDTLFGWIDGVLGDFLSGLNLTELFNSIVDALKPDSSA